jgi:hypothetical protein
MEIIVHVRLVHPLSTDDKDTLSACTGSPDFPKDIDLTLIEPRRPRIGLASIDPAVIDLVCKIGGGAAAGAVIAGMFGCISEWLKSRAQMVTIKVGEVSITAPRRMAGADLVKFTEKIAKISRSHEQELKAATRRIKVRKQSASQTRKRK